MNIKRGYKRLSLDMTSRYGNMQYELNVPYFLKGKLKICFNGYHLCKNILDTIRFYDSEDSKLFEVEYNADNYIETKNKICSDYIKIVREIPIEEYRSYIEEYIKNNDVLNEDWEIRGEIAKQGFYLDKLINDEDSYVRWEVAKQKYGLDKLVNDKNWYIRKEVARQGFGLDVLINDKDWRVRREVARQGYRLDVLVNDEDYDVRKEVAKQGFGLEKLINDEDCEVRKEVAKQGYGLDVLVDDEDFDVRCIAIQKLKELNNK